MPSLESQLLNAVAYRNEIAVEIANRLLAIAATPIDEIDTLVWGPYSFCADIADVEALNAAILLRAGASWEAMAFHLRTSRQAVHRRLAARGEELFAEATASGDDRTTDPGSVTDTFAEAEILIREGDDDAVYELLSTLGPRTHDQASYLFQIQDRFGEILQSPRARTDEVLELRKGPGDWMPKA